MGDDQIDDVWGTGGDGVDSDMVVHTGNESGTDLETPEEEAARLLQERNDFYTSIGIDPDTMKDAAPEDQAKIDAIIKGDMYGSNPDFIKSLTGAFKKTVNGKQVTDWDKVGLVGGLFAKATGLTKPETPGYKGKVKEYTAVTAPIKYDDTNRRPGSMGRQYFTPTTYVPAGGDVAAAQAAANQQAQGIMAALPATAPAVSKWNATNAVATPWARSVAPAPAPAAPSDEGIMTPEAKLESLKPKMAAHGGIMEAAKGRYLRGETDGMADKINTSIDGRQPAKLSHGEFVVPADVVSHLGNGNSDAGAKKLYQMMDKIRIARTGTKKQGREIDADRFLPGGKVGYSSGGITDVTPRYATGGPASGTSTAGNLSEWVGDYATSTIGKGAAAADQPYQAYTGPLTAGPSDLQQQQFAGISSLAQTGITPTQFSAGTFDTTQANKYMNPYIQTALDPQLKEMQRQADIARLSDAGRLTRAGAYGGSRQAIMESEGRRNLLDKQSQAIGTGYKNAYDAAMAQFNAEQNRGLDVQRAQEAANEASANFSRGVLSDLGQAGATQRAIEAEGIAADKGQFEEARDWDKKMAQYKMGLLSGMPTATQVNTQNLNPLTEWLQSGNTIAQLLESFKKP